MLILAVLRGERAHFFEEYRENGPRSLCGHVYSVWAERKPATVVVCRECTSLVKDYLAYPDLCVSE